MNMSWRSEGADVAKLSRWIRCLFQLALTSNIEVAEHLLSQVLTMAKDSEMVRRSLVDKRITPEISNLLFQTQSYPPEELEWLATTAFNRSVDFYCASQDSDCKRWVEKALNIAHLLDDGGVLHELLQTKYVGLRWND